MTSEDDFQAALDADPGDWQTRLVFGDWLEERADPRADGYRALGTHRKHPYHGDPTEPISEEARRRGWSWWGAGTGMGASHFLLHAAWREAIPTCRLDYPWGAWQPTRHAVEDAAALAFADLPADLRAELLAPKAG